MAENDVLFEKSKMTFGEHLEELRGALIKSLLAIAIGFGIGMFFAVDFVNFIKKPLQIAIDNYVLKDAEQRFTRDIEKRKENGETMPDDIDKILARRIQEGLAPREVFMEPKQLNIESEEELISMTVWERVADDPQQIIGTGVTQGFSVWMKAGLVLGLLIASPFVIYFVWAFVAAGLYPHERHYVYIFLPFSLILFFAGAALAFFGALYYVLDFLFWFYHALDIAPYPVINDWMSFILILPLGFGISFQLPLVMLFLERIGVFSVATYIKQWRIAVVVICVISTVLTPADPQSMILMAVPLVFLYFGGILLCKYMPRRKTPFGSLVES